MRILLIEDDQELCHVLKISLEKAGYQTDICLTGTDALYYALQPVYNLIILDRMLPGMDGLSLLKLIRSNEITTPVILATAIDAVPERIAGLDCGADDYIVKPYDIEELMARIRALIRRPGIQYHNTEADLRPQYPAAFPQGIHADGVFYAEPGPDHFQANAVFQSMGA